MNEVTLFYGKTNPELSNFYLSPLIINGVSYSSVEHYFMTEKARLFDPEGDAIKQMNNDKTPSQMKKLGRAVKNFDPEVWDRFCIDAMYMALRAKFPSADSQLGDILCRTGDSILGEASPFDRKWGIGLSSNNPSAQNPRNWRGHNLLGQLLMVIRFILRYDSFYQYAEESIRRMIPNITMQSGTSKFDIEEVFVHQTFGKVYETLSHSSGDPSFDGFLRSTQEELPCEISNWMLSCNLILKFMHLDVIDPNQSTITRILYDAVKYHDIWNNVFLGTPGEDWSR